MSSLTWTAAALSSNFLTLNGVCWRLVESQNRYATLKLVDTNQEQARLEDLLEDIKPKYPKALIGYDFLLFTPFRYKPYTRGSRFRREHQTEGVFYAAEKVETAVAESVYYRLLFFLESPDTIIPDNPAEFTGFSVKIGTQKTLDLTKSPFNSEKKNWVNKSSYSACQDLADIARATDCDIIRYLSVRCPKNGCNLALLSYKAFREKKPHKYETWKITIKTDEVIASREFPRLDLVFPRRTLENDPRIRKLKK